MKIILALLLSSNSVLASNLEAFSPAYTAKDQYTVEFSSTLGGCLKAVKPDTFSLNFGERAASGQCASDASIACNTRYTQYIGAAGGTAALESGTSLAGPVICTLGTCTEVQLTFDHDKTSDQDVLNFQTYEKRKGKAFAPRARRIPVAELLGETRRYVVAFGACEYAVLEFRVSKR